MNSWNARPLGIPGLLDASRRSTMWGTKVPAMQQEATVSWDPVVVHTSPLKTWHIVVAVLLFAVVIYVTVLWTRRRSEKNPGSLRLGEDDSASSERS
jgi:hypothetical protein